MPFSSCSFLVFSFLLLFFCRSTMGGVLFLFLFLFFLDSKKNRCNNSWRFVQKLCNLFVLHALTFKMSNNMLQDAEGSVFEKGKGNFGLGRRGRRERKRG